jgi:hypothetical protein
MHATLWTGKVLSHAARMFRVRFTDWKENERLLRKPQFILKSHFLIKIAKLVILEYLH